MSDPKYDMLNEHIKRQPPMSRTIWQWLCRKVKNLVRRKK